MSRRIRRQARYPSWKVFNPAGEYIAACHYAEDAAALVAAYGEGATIRWNRKNGPLVWTDGKDGSAGDSYDYCALVCNRSLDKAAEEGRH